MISFGHDCEYCVLCDEDFFLFILSFCSSVSGVCLSLYVPFSLIGCAGSVGISLASRVMYISCLCLRCVECRAGTIYLGTSVMWAAGLYGFSFFLCLCSGGYGTVELVRGGWSVFSLCFQFAVSSLGGWISAVGICCVIIFVGSFVVSFRGFLFYEVLIVIDLLQVVSQESAP